MQKKHLIALIMLAMKVSTVQLTLAIVFTCSVYANELNAQVILNKPISISVQQTELKKVIAVLQEQTGIKFIYSSKTIQADRKITCNVNQMKLSQFIEEVLKPLNIGYKIVDDKLLLFPLDDEKAALSELEINTETVADEGTVKGNVKNAKGEVLAGASVQLKNTSLSTATDAAGNFELKKIPTGTYIVVFSYVGFISKEQAVTVGDNEQTVNAQLSEDVLQLQQVVVTGGSANPLRKIESSVAVSTLNSKQIEARAPVSSADLLKAIPGLSVESSGGDGPGNVFVRGFPQQGGYIYLGIMEDGLPVLPTGFNSIPSADQFYKVDNTIKNMEAVRGGSAPIILPNSAGGVVNVLSFTGADKPYGKFKLTSGLSQGLYRADANIGGSLSANKKWKYNIGGFYRTDKGINNPSFTANEGGQVKLNVTYQFKEKSFIRFFGKYLNDKVLWILPGYYAYNPNGKPDPLTQYNYDLFDQTFTTIDTKFNVKMPEGNTLNVDLADGMHTKLGYGGMLLQHTTKTGWVLRNNFRYQKSKLAASYEIVTGAVPYDSSKKYYYLTGEQLQMPKGSYTNAVFNNTNGTLEQIIDFLDISKNIGKHRITMGLNFYQYNSDLEAASFVGQSQIAANPHRVLVGTSTGNGLTVISYINPGGHTITHGKSAMYSAYLTDNISISDRFRLDLAARIDNSDVKGDRAKYSGSSILQGGNGFVIDGTIPFSNNRTYWSATAGMNYKLSSNSALFARASKSYSAYNINDFSAVDFNPDNLKNRDIYVGELGWKYGKGPFALFSSLIYSSVKNASLSIAIPGALPGSLITQTAFGSTRTISAEIEATYQVTRNLNLRTITTLQDSRYTDYTFTPGSSARPDLVGKTYDWSGNLCERAPKIIEELSAFYSYKRFTVDALLRYTGQKPSSPSNSLMIKAFTEVNAGAGYEFFKGFKLRFWVNNLTNTRALTTGDVRGDQFLDPKTLVQGQIRPGRTILPRSYFASLSYDF